MPASERMSIRTKLLFRNMPKYEQLVWITRVDERSITLHMAGDLLTIDVVGEDRERRVLALAGEIEALIKRWKTCQFSIGAHYEFLGCLREIMTPFMQGQEPTSRGA
jgi:hypothetical protein